MPTQILTQLQYSEEREGPFRLYIYGPDNLHGGCQWVRREPRDEEEISCTEAMYRAMEAQMNRCEVRITDGGDFLVYHQQNGKVLYPQPIGHFWKEFCDGK